MGHGYRAGGKKEPRIKTEKKRERGDLNGAVSKLKFASDLEAEDPS